MEQKRQLAAACVACATGDVDAVRAWVARVTTAKPGTMLRCNAQLSPLAAAEGRADVLALLKDVLPE